MALGILGRCDAGGLGVLCAEVARHLAPERMLLLDLGDRGRGDCVTTDYTSARSGDLYQSEWRGGLSMDAVDWITAPGIDTLWSAEFWYGSTDEPEVLLAAHRRGIHTVCLAMPELAPWASSAPTRPRIRPREIHIPTSWRAETLPDARVLPMPVARDRLPFTHRTEVRKLYHVTGAAMRDRAGTDMLLAALPHVHEKCALTIRSERPINLLPGGSVDVEVVRDRAINYWDCVPADTDLLVMPRRYGGLSLPVQECASLGIPALMLSSDPYAGLPFVHSLSPKKSEQVNMKGGMVPVFNADPRALANAIDRLVREPEANAAASLEADRWAEEHSWHSSLGQRWCDALSAGCASADVAA